VDEAMPAHAARRAALRHALVRDGEVAFVEFDAGEVLHAASHGCDR